MRLTQQERIEAFAGCKYRIALVANFADAHPNVLKYVVTQFDAPGHPGRPACVDWEEALRTSAKQALPYTRVFSVFLILRLCHELGLRDPALWPMVFHASDFSQDHLQGMCKQLGRDADNLRRQEAVLIEEPRTGGFSGKKAIFCIDDILDFAKTRPQKRSGVFSLLPGRAVDSNGQIDGFTISLTDVCGGEDILVCDIRSIENANKCEIPHLIRDYDFEQLRAIDIRNSLTDANLRDKLYRFILRTAFSGESDYVPSDEDVSALSTALGTKVAQPPTPTSQICLQDEINTTGIIKQHTKIIGRQFVKTRIQEFIHKETCGLFVIEGEQGIGKTALLANLACELQPLARQGYVTAYFCRSGSITSSLAVCFRDLCRQLSAKYSLPIYPLPSQAEELASKLSALLRLATRGSCAVGDAGKKAEILIIDGINEADDPAMLVRLLPKELPDGVFVILSSRSGPHLDIIDTTRATCAHHRYIIEAHSAENLADARDFIKMRQLDWPEAVVEEIAVVASGNFQFLDVLTKLKDVATGKPEDAVKAARSLGRETGDPLEALYAHHWACLRTACLESSPDIWDDVTTLLGILAISFEDLTETQLRRFAGNWSYGRLDVAVGQVRGSLVESHRHDDSQAERLFALHHDTFRHFVLGRMSSALPLLHGQIVESYMGPGDKRRPIEQTDNYGLRHLVSHALASEHPHTANDVVSPAFLREKTFRFKSRAPILEDLDHLIAYAAGRKDLATMFRYALLKGRVATTTDAKTTPLELLLRARLGEIDGPLAEVAYSENKDDALFILTEIVAFWSARNAELADKYAAMLAALAEECSGQAIEHAALRLAGDLPEVSIKLAEMIPEPEILKDFTTGGENPTAGRAVFGVFARMAAVNQQSALALDDLLSWPSHKCLAHLAVAHAMYGQDPCGAADALCGAADYLSEDAGGFLLTQYVVWLLPRMTGENAIALLNHVQRFFRVEPKHMLLPGFLDVRIQECPPKWLEVLGSISPGPLNSLIRWRMIEMGLLDESTANEVNESPIDDLLRGGAVANRANADPLGASQIADRMDTVLGHAYAIAMLARLIGKDDPATAALLLESAHDSIATKDGWIGFHCALYLLHASLSLPKGMRPELLGLCLERLSELKPRSTRVDAKRALWVTVEQAMKESGNQPAFFRDLLLERESEIWRNLVATGMVEYCHPETWITMGRERKSFGLVPDDTDIASTEQSLLLPKTQVETLIALAERISLKDKSLAAEILADASALLKHFANEDGRTSSARAMMRCATIFSPLLAVEIYDRCNVDFTEFQYAVRDALQDLVGAQHSALEAYVRLAAEMFVGLDKDGRDPGSNYAKKRYAAMETMRIPSIDSPASKGQIPSKAWFEELPEFFNLYFSRIEPKYRARRHGRISLESPHFYDLRKFGALIGLLDWTTLLRLAEIPEIGPLLVGKMESEDLRASLLCATNLPEDLLRHIERISRLDDENEAEKGFELSSFDESIIAVAVARAPGLALELISFLPEGHRHGWVYDAEDQTPSVRWTETQMCSLVDLLSVNDQEERGIVAAARIVSWLTSAFDTPKTIIDKIHKMARKLDKAASIADIASAMASVSEDVSKDLYLRALDACEERGYARGTLDILEKATWIPADKQAQALNVAREAATAGDDSYALQRIVPLQAKVRPHDALRTLRCVKDDDSNLHEMVGQVADAVPITNEEAVDSWMTEFRALPNIGESELNRSAVGMLKTGIENGVVRAAEKFRYVTNLADKVELLVLLAGRTQGPLCQTLLGEAEEVARGAPHDTVMSRAFLLLVHAYADADKEKAIDLIHATSAEMQKSGNAMVFTLYINTFVDRALDLPPDIAHAGGNGVRDAIHKYPYGKNFLLDRGGERSANLVALVPIFWVAGQNAACELIDEAVQALSKEPQSQPSFSWTYSVYGSVTKLADRRGSDAGVRALGKIMSALPEVYRTATADGVAKHLSEVHGDNTSPLEDKFNIFQKELDKTKIELLNCVLPFCSPEASAKIHLAFAVTAWTNDRHLAATEMKEALVCSKAVPNLSYSDKENVYVAYAALHGDQGVADAIITLSKDIGRSVEGGILSSPEDFSQTASKLFIAAAEQERRPAQLIQQSWACRQALDAYS